MEKHNSEESLITYDTDDGGKAYIDPEQTQVFINVLSRMKAKGENIESIDVDALTSDTADV